MHYYIDGYNLLFRKLNAADNLQIQRQRIINELSQKIIFLDISATLVFDAQYQTEPFSCTHKGCLEIHFTDHGKTADDHILALLKRQPNPQEYTVVTSDKTLAWRARRRLAKTQTIEDFILLLNSRCKNKLKKVRESQTAPIQQEQDIKTDSKTIVETKSPKKPSLQVRAEECFDYYLQQFETSYQSMPSPSKSAEPSQKKEKKKRKHSIKKSQDSASIYKSWIDAFERDINQDHSDPWSD